MPPPALRNKSGPTVRRRKTQWGLPFWFRALVSAGGLGIVGLLALLMVAEDGWNPLKPVDPDAPVTLMTPIKLMQTAGNPQFCRDALAGMAQTDLGFLADQENSPQCQIRNRVRIRALSGTMLPPVDTRCDTALRMAMWTRHVIQPAALGHFGSPAVELLHFSSYSCRRMRTSRGESSRMSAHATARAIDISGVRLANGRVISLKDSWDGPEGPFWREVRDGACTYFRTVLSPDYNALHANHFHLAQGRWPACR